MNYKIYTGLLANEDEMSSKAKASFEGGYQTVVLPAGYVLWRFISSINAYRFSDFWVDAPAMANIMNGLHMTGNFSEAYKINNVRDSLAIPDNWENRLRWRLKIRLNKEVIAYVGRTGPQKYFVEVENTIAGGAANMDKAVEHRIGGFGQYVIPRFRGLPNENDWAQLEHFAHI